MEAVPAVGEAWRNVAYEKHPIQIWWHSQVFYVSLVWLKPECLLSSVKSTINPFHPLLKSHFGLTRGKTEKQRKQACFKTIQILKSARLGRSPFCGQG